MKKSTYLPSTSDACKDVKWYPLSLSDCYHSFVSIYLELLGPLTKFGWNSFDTQTKQSGDQDRSNRSNEIYISDMWNASRGICPPKAHFSARCQCLLLLHIYRFGFMTEKTNDSRAMTESVRKHVPFYMYSPDPIHPFHQLRLLE